MIPASVSDRIGDLALEYGLPEAAPEQLAAVLTALSSDYAPTAVHDPCEGVDVHVADSLSALPLIKSGEHSLIADIGSGCGIPGLVLAAALPESRVVEIDSQRKRTGFVEEAVATAGLANVEAVWTRAEQWIEGRGTCDVVTARALADLAVVLEYGAPLLRQGGLLVAWKGKLDGGELERGVRAAEQLGMSCPEAVPVTPWPGSGTRHLVVSRLTGEVPAGFPRRPGMAAKRPLGS